MPSTVDLEQADPCIDNLNLMRFTGYLFDILLQVFAQAQFKAQLGDNKQRADKQAN